MGSGNEAHRQVQVNAAASGGAAITGRLGAGRGLAGCAAGICGPQCTISGPSIRGGGRSGRLAPIARDLGLSIKTVRNHASNVFAKLHVAHRAQAIVLAREAGIESGEVI